MTVQRTRNREVLQGALPVLLMIAVIVLVCAPAWASAAPEAATTSMAVDSSLSPVEARRLRFLFWGYAAIWVLLGGYVLSLGWRLRAVRAEIARVRDRLTASGTRSGVA